jgi:hypothetical protein
MLGDLTALAKHFHLTQAHPLSIPLDPHINLYNANTNSEAIDTTPYSKLTGSLMYVAIGTQPDIAYPVSTFTHFMLKSKHIHWEAGNRVLRYLISSKSLVLTFGLDDTRLAAYTDSDHTSHVDRHSVSGNIFLYDSTAIAWSSHKQPLIALSSTEAKYIATASTACEITWLREVVGELSHLSPSPTPLYCDNQSAIALAKSGLMNARTKHIDLRYHYVCDTIETGLISLSYVHTNEQVANALTKVLPCVKLEHLALLEGEC